MVVFLWKDIKNLKSTQFKKSIHPFLVTLFQIQTLGLEIFLIACMLTHNMFPNSILDVNVKTPDKKSIMMYLMCFFQVLPHSNIPTPSEDLIPSTPSPATDNSFQFTDHNSNKEVSIQIEDEVPQCWCSGAKTPVCRQRLWLLSVGVLVPKHQSADKGYDSSVLVFWCQNTSL